MIGSHSDNEVPQHPCLELVSNSEEKLTLLISRRLITMKKITEYDISWDTNKRMKIRKQTEYKQFTKQSIVTQNLSYSDIMESVGMWKQCEMQTISANRSEGKTRSQRRERQVENAKKWKKTEFNVC